jgi:hypothetical protein
MKGNGKEIIGEFFHADNSFLIKTVFSLENKSAICTFLSVKSIKSLICDYYIRGMIKIRKNILVIFVVSLVLLTGLSVFSDYSRMKTITEKTSDFQLPGEASDCFISKADFSGDEQLNQIPVNCLLVENVIIIVNRDIPGMVSQTGLRHWQPPKK